ncbi:hypothetical protein ASC55_00750 [Microbacterium sp. Root322]|uniref:hypothetical protein n=1 Tax=Microbacterium sp. Root322 TaxID=1736514 RepID=UPI0006FAB759|nr:hypothetical protein [Microbacterium sp. Root322]KQV03554.1 hypothetical protein ASC55_00750 [Microbacterium sp. Root322]
MGQTLRDGGHQLPVQFSAASSAPVPTPPRRSTRTGLLLGLLGGAAVIAALAITQVTSNLGYDSAASQYENAAETTSSAKAQVRDDIADLRAATDAAGRVISGGNQPIAVPDDVHAGLASAVEDSTATASDADGVVATDIPAVGTKPGWFWELFGATSELDERLRDVDALADELVDASTDIEDARATVTESGLAVITTAGEAAPGFEGAHLSARTETVIALRDAAAEATAATAVDEDAATAYLALQDAAAQVIATENEELAEKAGPLLDTRLEIETFARSLAPGVLLDFDWAPVVSGAGYNGSMGGYTTWWWGEKGRATIALSNSVAEQWPGVRSKALVAHEVGHAISVKCQSMYDSSTQDSIEKWATAWAISMGYTDDANGVWAYGYPPQNYIDAAAGCR